MDPLDNIHGAHRVVTLDVPGRKAMKILCLVQKDSDGQDAYYVLAECDGRATKWRSMIRDNTVRRLRDEFVGSIVSQDDVDNLDVETIFFCTAEASNKA